MGILRLGRFLKLLAAPWVNPYTVLALVLILAGLLTGLHGPKSLGWGVVLIWMAGVLRLLHSQRSLLRQQNQLLEDFGSNLKRPLAPNPSEGELF